MLRTLLSRLRGPWVSPDPHNDPTGLDRVGGTYPTHDQIAAAVRRGTTTLRSGTTLLKPQDVERVTREVMAVLDGEQPVEFWPVSGEVGDVDAIRTGRAAH